MQISASRPVSLYIHWPFCLKKCPYCDFNSHVREVIPQEEWKKGLLRELNYYAELLPGRPLQSIFFGGGTPSLMPPDTVASIIDAAINYWPAVPTMEVTLEANPTSTEATKLTGFRTAGVNRVSLGVQSLRDDVLKMLGREHSAKEALLAVEVASRIFSRYNFDLIYARPGQTPEDWEKELREGLSYASTHLSLYQLTIEPGTAFYHARARGDLTEIPDETAAELFGLTQNIMEARGLPAYEISNHATPGFESQHNLTYWRYQDYIGVGPGAHGRLTIEGEKLATQALKSPEKWLEKVSEIGHGQELITKISAIEQIEECLLMGLRLREGINRERFEIESGKTLESAIDPAALQRLVLRGLVEIDRKGLRVLPEGWLYLNHVIGELVA